MLRQTIAKQRGNVLERDETESLQKTGVSFREETIIKVSTLRENVFLLERPESV